jgi:hypothetical protein
MITQAQLKNIFDYDKITGNFTRIVKTSNRVNVGDIAGCKNQDGYLSISIGGVNYCSHRLAWLYVYGAFPVNSIDHMNGITCDNKISNLRDVNHSTNGKNSKTPKTNNSGFIGVRYRNKKWTARIHDKGNSFHLGSFDVLSDAVKARIEAEERMGYHPNHGR